MKRLIHCKGPWLVVILLGLAFSLLLSGCDQREVGPVSNTGSSQTITVTDCIGREVAIPANPQRLACLCPESGHAMAMFGKGEQIAATVQGIKRDLIMVEMYPHIKEVPVPKTSGVINIEELAVCHPDVVFVKEDTGRNQMEAAKMNKSRLPFLVVEFNNMKEQQEAVAMMGKAVGAESQAKKYNQYYQQCINRVAKRTASIPEAERIRIYHSVSEATRTDTAGTLPADWTRAAGAINVSLDQELRLYEGKNYASLEQILLWNPDFILVNEPNVVSYIMNNEQWAPLQAVKNRRVLSLPNGITRWGHFSSLETPLVVMWTAKTLYPDKFTDIDMEAETKFFYKEFFNLELSDKTVETILSGVAMRQSK